MEIDWQQLGAAGILGLFALQVIREILNFKGHSTGGYVTVKKAVSDSLQPLAQDLREVRVDTEKLRLSQHRANDIQTGVAGKLDLAHVKLDALVRHTEQTR